MKRVFIKKELRIPFTKEGYQKVLEEKQKLLGERPDAVDHLRKAREMGDLSENGYYKASRGRLSFIDTRLRRLDRLRRFGIIVQSTGSGRVEIGSRVAVRTGNTDLEYTIVGGYESDPSKKTISHSSPVGKALMGKKKDDSVEVITPKGIVSYTILAVYPGE